tara:strand:- start:76 stop:528 length:453 start_codon:yes stop_codon:yes gene_type:complete
VFPIISKYEATPLQSISVIATEIIFIGVSPVSQFSKDSSSGIERIIQEYVPGKQVTLAHLLANPTEELCHKVGVEHAEAIGILTLTPGETAIIAGDVATKFASVEIGFLDRFSGALVVTGSIGAVDEALSSVLETLETVLGYRVCPATRT